MHAAMLAWRHVQRQTIRAMHHNSVSADVHPIFFRVARDYQIVGADVAPAVELVPARHGKLEHVDVFALLDVFEERSGSNRFSANRCNFLHLLAPSLDKIHIAQTRFHAERQRQTSDRRNQIRRDPIALGIILDPVENDRRSRPRALVDDFRKRRQLEIPVSVFNGHQLAEFINVAKPSA